MKKTYYKILHENQKHRGMQYHLGLNEDIEPFDETPECKGGIFFADKKHVLDYLIYSQGTKLAIIEIPEGEKIIQVKNKYKAHRIIIAEIKDLWSDENYEWLVSHFGDNSLFQCACENGALSFAKRLFKDKKIDIYLDVNAVFCYACANGHLEVAKWLYSLGDVDIHADNEWASRHACMNGHLEIVKWLTTLDSKTLKKGFLDIKVGDIVWVTNEYSHDIDAHKLKVETIEFDEEYINGIYNPNGMRCYGRDLDYWNEEEQDYDTDDYITVVTESNFLGFEE